jgi:hypothetical protein
VLQDLTLAKSADWNVEEYMGTYKEQEDMKLHNNEMHNLYSPTSNTRMINSKRMRGVVHAA